MKKQILFLAIFSLAVLAGTNNAWGQLTTSGFGTDPIPLTLCVGTPQQPKAGVPYRYEFLAGSTATSYTWWATKDPDFVSTVPTTTNQTSDSLKVSTGDLIAVSANYWDTTGTAGVDITWSADLLSRTSYQTAVGSPGTVLAPTSTFVVGWGTDGCTDNIKVWEIDPIPSFTVDITVIDDATRAPLAYADNNAKQCVDEVRAAKYNTTNNNVDYNFGWDTLYYEVVAANFSGDWVPTFFLTGLDGTIQTAEIGWASSFANAQAGTFIESGDITAGTITGATGLNTALLDNSGGVSLYVRVVIENNNYETLVASTIGLSVAGEDETGFDITDDVNCTQPATAVLAAADDATSRSITPRPELEEGTTIILPVGAVTNP
jgi:hypothetical protein